MTQIYEYMGLFIVSFWVAFRVLYPFVSRELALYISGVIIVILYIFSFEIITILIAIFAPFGILLPTLALQDIARKCKVYDFGTYPVHELVLVLIIYVAFLSASIGVFHFDPYRFGYSPAIGSSIALTACGYALWRGYYVIAVALILGQIAWTFDLGSSNYFDHMTHVIIVPIIFIVLVKKVIQLFR